MGQTLVTTSAGFLAASVAVRGEVAATVGRAVALNRTVGLIGDEVVAVVRADVVLVAEVAEVNERAFGGAVAVIDGVVVELAVGRVIGALNNIASTVLLL